jgi:hypothetical protein
MLELDRPARTGPLPCRAVQVALGSGRVATARGTLAGTTRLAPFPPWLGWPRGGSFLGFLLVPRSILYGGVRGVMSRGQFLSQPLQLASVPFSGRVPRCLSPASVRVWVNTINKQRPPAYLRHMLSSFHFDVNVYTSLQQSSRLWHQFRQERMARAHKKIQVRSCQV